MTTRTDLPQVTPDANIQLERPARVLLGWMNDEQAKLYLSGRQRGIEKPEYAEKILRTRESVNSRAVGVDQTGIIEEPPDELQTYVDNLKNHPKSSAYFLEGWTVKIVNLLKVCAAQPIVFVDHAEERVLEVDPNNIISIASVSLPTPMEQPTHLPAQFDQTKNAWIFSSRNPNLRIAGHFGGQVGEGFTGFGFVVQLSLSFVQVASLRGRYLLRDGYHRTYGLIKRGITKIPALVRDFNSLEEVGLPPGLLPQDAYLGDRPALLEDYHNNSVSEQIRMPATEKLIIIQGIELSTLG